MLLQSLHLSIELLNLVEHILAQLLHHLKSLMLDFLGRRYYQSLWIQHTCTIIYQQFLEGLSKFGWILTV